MAFVGGAIAGGSRTGQGLRVCTNTRFTTCPMVGKPMPSAALHRTNPQWSMQAEVGIKKDTAERMAKSVDSVRANFNTIRTGRANASILDRVVVSYYGTETPLKQLASIGVPSSSTLTIEPYDKSCIRDIERALMESDLGLTPNSDGQMIRLAIPPLTQERRKELAKQIKALAEEGRVALRNIRRDAVEQVKKIEKEGDIGKDQSKDLQDEIQKLTNKYSKIIDEDLASKEKEVMKV